MALQDNGTSTAFLNTTSLPTTISTSHYTTSATSILWNSTSLTSTPAINGSTLATTTFYNSTVTEANTTNSSENGCLRILYKDLGNSRVRIWDVVLFIPNLLFLIFLVYRFYKSRGRVYRGLGGTSPIFTTYFVLVTMTALFSVIRCIVSMTVDVTSVAGSDANKILWVILRFFLLMAEMSVLVFGLACGHLDRRSSIRRVFLITTCLALVYSVTQGVLEMTRPDLAYQVQEESWTVYGHGGSLFSLITSIIFCAVYVFVDILPFYDCMKQYFTVPTKKTFYVYISCMAVVYFCFSLGSGLLYKANPIGLCILDAAALIYFIFFAPLLYWAFLHSYLSNIQQNSVLFSYSAQVDEALDDIHDGGSNSARPGADFNGVLVFDRMPSSTYENEKTGIQEPLHDLAGEEKDRHDSEAANSSMVNFFKDVDLGDNDDELNFR